MSEPIEHKYDIDGHLGCLQLLAITNLTLMKMFPMLVKEYKLPDIR